MNGTPIACGVCGFALGTGLPGSGIWCDRCQAYVVAAAQQQNWDALIAGLVVLGVGLLIGAAVASS